MTSQKLWSVRRRISGRPWLKITNSLRIEARISQLSNVVEVIADDTRSVAPAHPGFGALVIAASNSDRISVAALTRIFGLGVGVVGEVRSIDAAK